MNTDTMQNLLQRFAQIVAAIRFHTETPGVLVGTINHWLAEICLTTQEYNHMPTRGRVLDKIGGRGGFADQIADAFQDGGGTLDGLAIMAAAENSASPLPDLFAQLAAAASSVVTHPDADDDLRCALWLLFQDIDAETSSGSFNIWQHPNLFTTYTAQVIAIAQTRIAGAENQNA